MRLENGIEKLSGSIATIKDWIKQYIDSGKEVTVLKDDENPNGTRDITIKVEKKGK